MDGEEDLPLHEALEAFSDPVLWQRFQEAARAAAGHRRGGSFVGPGGEPLIGAREADEVRRRNRLVTARKQAWRAVEASFLARLQQGELVASGVPVPMTPAGRRQRIRAELWRVLRPGFRSSTAKGGGLALVQVRVRAQVAGAAAEPPRPSVELDAGAAGPRRPGPKSIMDEIRAEMLARNARGELLPIFSQECRALERFAQKNFPNHPRPLKAKSIENHLRHEYRKLVEAKGPRI